MTSSNRCRKQIVGSETNPKLPKLLKRDERNGNAIGDEHKTNIEVALEHLKYHLKEFDEIWSRVAQGNGNFKEPENEKAVVEQLLKGMTEKEEEVQGLEDLNRVLIVKEWTSNDELQEARKVLIKELCSQEVTEDTVIGVKRMGELDQMPFQVAARRMGFSRGGDAAARFCCFWEKQMRDVSWHPFKVIRDGDKYKEIIDDEDEKLKDLNKELGHGAYKAVTRAMKEMNEYNPSGRQIVQELWNFKEARRATLAEAICCQLRLANKQKKELERSQNAVMEEVLLLAREIVQARV